VSSLVKNTSELCVACARLRACSVWTQGINSEQ
jgi:hypothetical protein